VGGDAIGAGGRRRCARIGWWRIDPRTLQTVGVMDTGSLQNTVEYSVTTRSMASGSRISTESASARRACVGREAIRQRAATSWNQWLNLLSYAQRSINTTGLLPPL
jgi:hypothetical protein